MKNLTFTIILLAFASISFGNTADIIAKEVDVDGFKVIYKHSPKDVLSVKLFIRGGTANYSASQQGIEKLALTTVVEGGTNSLNKIDFSTAAEKIGASFEASATYDFSSISMTCITMFWEESWSLFKDAVMDPSFNENEFQIVKEQLMSAAMQSESNPDVHLRNLAMSEVFKGKSYSRIPDGTPQSLGGLELATVKSFYNTLIDKEKCFLVVVGNISEADLVAKVKSSLSKIPKGKKAPKSAPAMISTAESHVEDRDIATNYIRGIFNAPNKLSDEAVPMQIGMNILGDRYFLELRTKRSLSYAPAAFYASLAISNPYNVIYISTIDPKQSIEVMVEEINKIKKEGFLDKELRDQKQVFLTYHYMGLETSASQANDLGMAEIAGGWELADKFTDQVNATTLSDMNRVFDKYTNAIHWVYLGKKDMVQEEDFIQTKTYKDKPY